MSRRGVKPLRLSLGSEDGGDRVHLARDANSSRTQGVTNAKGKMLVNLDRLRAIVRASLAKNLFENAVFFANKLVTLSGGQAKDIYLLAHAYFSAKQFRRAVHLVQQHGFLSIPETRAPLKTASQNSQTNRSRFSLETTPKHSSSGRQNTAVDRAVDVNIEFVLLAVQCLIESGQHEEAQNVLEAVLGDAGPDALRARAEAVPRSFHAVLPGASEENNLADVQINPIASLCLLRGRVYETLDNRLRAAIWYKNAIVCDIYCYEAFDALIDNQLRPSEERHLLAELERIGAFNDENEWLKAVYESRLSKHDYNQQVEDRFSCLELVTAAQDPSEAFIDPKQNNLSFDLDCAADKAEGLYQQHDAQGAYQVTRKIRLRDPYHLRCISVHLASLVELKRKSELFHTAHQLVDAYPSLAVSWFAVGCYYYCIAKFDAARRYFHKATTMDPSFVAAWLGFGHSFAAQDESDQAMAAYRTSSRLFIGCHLPVLCTAIEYLRTNNVTLAEQFCRQAKSMCATDPLVFNELGVVHYRQQRYEMAVDCFQEALNLCRNQPERLRYAWEPAMFNLGHSYRKLCRYDEAIEYYLAALSFNPKAASTYAALGLTYHLQGRIDDAVTNYHNALGLKPEDTFASEMLDKALVESYASMLGDAVLSED